MRLNISLFFFVCQIFSATSILKDGPCPLYESSPLPNNSYRLKVIGKAPLTRIKSYVFGDRVRESCEIDLLPWGFMYSESNDGLQCPVVSSKLKNSTKGIMEIESVAAMFKHHKPMDGTVTEAITFHFMDDNIVMWSCKDIPYDDLHDEALVIGIPVNANFLEVIDDVVVFVTNIFPLHLVRKIVWEGPFEGSTFCRPSDCIPLIYPEEFQLLDKKNYPRVIVGGIIFVILLVVVCFCVKSSFCKGSSLVHPVVE